MKVEGPSRSQGADKAKRKGTVQGGDSSFGDMVSTGEATESSGSAITQSIATIDSLLTLQGTDDPAQRAARGRMRARAGNVLQELDRIKISLLTGTLTVGHVIDIADVVASHREKIMDPQLTAILDEVDLRAQIELAKMRQALNKHA